MSARHAAAPHHHFQHAASSPIIEHRSAALAYGPEPYQATQQGQGQGPSALSPSIPRARSPMYGPAALQLPASAGSSIGGTSSAHETPAPSPLALTHPPSSSVKETEQLEITRARENGDEKGRLIVNGFLIGQRLGNGQHGEVYQGWNMKRDYMLVVRITLLSLICAGVTYANLCLLCVLPCCCGVRNPGHQGVQAQEPERSKDGAT